MPDIYMYFNSVIFISSHYFDTIVSPNILEIIPDDDNDTIDACMIEFTL